MPAQRYRELRAPSVIDTGISQSNAGSEAEALARTFSQFEQTGLQYAGQMRQDQGLVEGEAAGATGDPQLRKGLGALTAYGQAYNNAAIRSYAIKVDADADETEARIREQAGTDPDKYKALMSASLDGLLKEADPQAAGVIREIYNRRIGAGTARLIQEQAIEVKNENRVTTKLGTTQAVERIGRLRAEGDHEGAEVEKVKLDMMIQAAEADGTFTPAEVKMLKREADIGLLAQEEVSSFARELEGGDPQAYIERLKQDYAQSEILTAAEEDKVVDTLFAQWRQHNAMVAARQAEAVAQHTDAVMQTFERLGQDAGASQLRSLPGVPEGLKDAVRGKVLEDLNQRRSVAREANVDSLVKVARDEANNTVGADTYATVEQLYSRGALTPEQYASQLAGLDSKRITKAGDTASAAEVERSLETGIPLDPTDPKIKRALDGAFAVHTAGLDEGSPEWRSTALAFAARTRTLPQSAISWAEKMRRSPNAEQAVPAAQFLSALHETAPQALEGVDEKTRAYASLVNDMAGAGADPVMALELAKKAVYETDKNVLENLKNTWRTSKYDESSDGALNSFIDQDFDTAFDSQPGADLGLKSAFRAQTRRYFDITGGDIEKARELAWKDMKRNYAVSEVNGVKQMMLAPPELFGVTPEMVQKDIGPGRIIVPDSKTQREVLDIKTGMKRPPTYAVFEANGLPVVIDNVPQRYALPASTEMAEIFEKRREEAEATESRRLDEMRRYRDARRKNYETDTLDARKPGDF